MTIVKFEELFPKPAPTTFLHCLFMLTTYLHSSFVPNNDLHLTIHSRAQMYIGIGTPT